MTAKSVKITEISTSIRESERVSAETVAGPQVGPQVGLHAGQPPLPSLAAPWTSSSSTRAPPVTPTPTSALTPKPLPTVRSV